MRKNRANSDEMSIEEMIKQAKLRAMYLLKIRDRTEWQLKMKLKQDGFLEEAINEAVDYVKVYRYIDDTDYARRYIEFRKQTKSKNIMQRELQQKGISSEIIETAMLQIDCNDLDALKKAVEKKCRNLSLPLEEKQQQKLIASLLRKGFLLSDIKRELVQFYESNVNSFEIT